MNENDPHKRYVYEKMVTLFLFSQLNKDPDSPDSQNESEHKFESEWIKMVGNIQRFVLCLFPNSWELINVSSHPHPHHHHHNLTQKFLHHRITTNCSDGYSTEWRKKKWTTLDDSLLNICGRVEQGVDRGSAGVRMYILPVECYVIGGGQGSAVGFDCALMKER